MKKSMATILSLCLLASTTFSPTAGLLAPKTTMASGAEQAGHTYRCSGVTEGYFALSNDNALYLFNEKNGGFWQEYTHPNHVTEMHFSNDGDLYYLDDKNELYKLPLATLVADTQAEKMDECETFFLYENSLYLADVSLRQTELSVHSLTDGSITTYTFKDFYKAFAFDGATLYGLNSSNELCVLDLTTQQATPVVQFPGGSKTLAFVNTTAFTSTDDGSLYAYDVTAPSSPILQQTGSYTALSAYANKAYFLNGNAMQTATATGEIFPADGAFLRPLVHQIPTEDLQTELSTGAGKFTVVETADSALLVEVTDDGGEYFQYRQNVRTTPIQALQIATRSGYALLAYRKNPSEGYKTYLVDESLLTEKTDGTLTYERAKIGYLTNAVKLYKYPHLGLSTTAELPKDAALTIIGEIKGLDCDYYAVRYGEQTGYIPQAYATAENNSPPQAEELTAGEIGRDVDAIWRMAYLILGSGAICILSDFLILRKKRED